MRTDDEIWQENSEKAEARLKPILTKDFLTALRLAAKTHGWSGDHIEVASFVEWCFELAEKDVPELAPYDYSVNKPTPPPGRILKEGETIPVK